VVVVALSGKPASAGDLGPGSLFAGRFTLLEALGSGSMGTVYRAADFVSKCDVALKVLRADRAIDGGARARFLREATTTSRLSSPHTVRVLDFGEDDHGRLFIAMELLRGESLADRLRRVGRLSVDATFDVLRQALRSLAEAHEKGIVHRDLKPANLFLAENVGPSRNPRETLKVLDFGVAKLLEPDGSGQALHTLAGTVLGTPCYMSPEQALGRPLDARSDLYSLGVIAYELLTGRPPFVDATNLLVMARHVRMAPPPLRHVAPDLAISATVEAALMRVLAKNPSKRPSSASAMIALLDRAQGAAATTISGVRPAVAARLRSVLGPTVQSPELARAAATIHTRALVQGATFGAVHRETIAAVALAIGITAAALWMWTTSPVPQGHAAKPTKPLEDSSRTVAKPGR
jgi:serine/threonine-protein kinase